MSSEDFPGGPVVKTLCASNAGGEGSIPNRGTKIPHPSWRGPPPTHTQKNGLWVDRWFVQGQRYKIQHSLIWLGSVCLLGLRSLLLYHPTTNMMVLDLLFVHPNTPEGCVTICTISLGPWVSLWQLFSLGLRASPGTGKTPHRNPDWQPRVKGITSCVWETPI